MSIKKFTKLIFLIVICNGLGSLGTLVTRGNLTGWYSQLSKPEFNPPNWIFAPVWSLLFTLMAIALYLLLENRKNKEFIRPALYLFCVQFIFNIAWTFLFFGLKNPALAFIDIILLLLFITLTLLQFEKTNRLAAYLLLPYLFWVSFASVLNFSIWMINT